MSIHCKPSPIQAHKLSRAIVRTCLTFCDQLPSHPCQITRRASAQLATQNKSANVDGRRGAGEIRSGSGASEEMVAVGALCRCQAPIHGRASRGVQGHVALTVRVKHAGQEVVAAVEGPPRRQDCDAHFRRFGPDPSGANG